MAEFFNAGIKNVDTDETVLFTSTSDSTIILSLLASNTDGTSPVDVTAINRNSSSDDEGYIAFTITVPANANFDLLGNKYILPSGNRIGVSCSLSGGLDIQASYVVV